MGAALCADSGFRLFGAMATMIAGWALAENGNADAEATRIADGLTAVAANGAGMMLPFFLACSARHTAARDGSSRRSPRSEQGLGALATSGCYYKAEPHRHAAKDAT